MVIEIHKSAGPNTMIAAGTTGQSETFMPSAISLHTCPNGHTNQTGKNMILSEH
jgi:hypothetical protein